MAQIATQPKTYRIVVSLENSHKLDTGLGEFENSIATRLARRAPELKARYGITLCFLVAKGHEGAYGPDVEYMSISRNRRRLINFSRFVHVSRWLIPHIDLLHYTNQFFKFKTRLAPVQLLTVHDLNYLHNNIGRMRLMKKNFLTRQRLGRATQLTFISDFARHDVEKHFHTGKPSRVIKNGVTNLNTESQQVYDRVLSGMGLQPGYLFHISRLASKKSVHLIVEMMRHLPHERLVVAGTGRKSYVARLHALVEQYHLTNVQFVGRVSTLQKAALLSRCKALLFPSISEGFGLPVAEAMCFGRPVFITRLTSLPEVGGRHAYYFNTLQPDDMARTVEEGLNDFASSPEEKAKLLKQRAATFDWDTAVDQYVDYYLDLLKLKNASA